MHVTAPSQNRFFRHALKVSSDQTHPFVTALGAALADGWMRATTEENRTHEISSSAEFYYYVCDKRGTRPAALLAIYRRDAATLYVSNVVPKDTSQLNHDQYNAVLRDFHDKVLTKVHALFPVAIMLASDQFRIEDTMSADAFSQLESFSHMANRSTGSAHPSDRDVWYRFLTTLAREKHKLDSHWLRRWLIEVEKWPARTAGDLAIEFEFGIGLLAFNEKPPVSHRRTP